MADLATLRVVVDANGAIRAVDQFGRTTERAAKQSSALTSALGLVTRAFGAIGAVAAARQLIQTADTMRQLEGRIKLVTKSQSELVAVQNELRQSATRTRAPYEDTVRLYARFAQATEELGLSQKEVISFTERLNMLVKISGSSTAEASAALFQLSQGLNSGALRGQEFNSVFEQTPAVIRAIAEGMGIPISKMRELAFEGRLTSREIVDAITRMDQSIRGDFSAAPVTAAEGWTLLKDAISQTVGEIDKASGASSNLSKALGFIARAIRAVSQSSVENDKRFGDFFGIESLSRDAVRRGATGAFRGTEWVRGAAPAPVPEVISFTTSQIARDFPKPPPSTQPNAEAIAAAQRVRELQSEIAQLNPLFAGLTGNAQELGAILSVLREATDNAGAALETRFARLEEEREQALRILPLLEGENGQRKNAVQLVKSLGGATDRLSESARVFLEQTQIAVARFAADFLKDGFSSVGRFWEDFKDLGRQAIGNVFAKQFMDGIGGKIGDKLSSVIGGAMGKLSGLGGGILGPIGAMGVAAAGLLGAAKAQREAAAEQRRLMAESMRTAALNGVDWDADFLTFKGTESPTERALRNIRESRDRLAEQARGTVSSYLPTPDMSGGFSEMLRRALQMQDLERRKQQAAVPFGLGKLSPLSSFSTYLDDFVKRLLELNGAFESNTKAVEAQLAVERMAERQRQATSLTQFRDSLNLSAQSPLSPTAQLAEARRQYEVILALAKGGDQSAISSLPETARTLLDASRAVNASGVRYAQDFAKVTSDTTAIIDALRQEPIDVTDTILERTEPWFADALATADASLAVQQTGFQSVVDELVAVRSEISTMKKALVIALDEVAAAV